MVASGHLDAREPIDIGYRPPRRTLPIEVVDLATVLARKPGAFDDRERVGFNLLIVCTAGHGTHAVDFEPFELAAGTCLRVYPGQVQQYMPSQAFDAQMIVWPSDAASPDPVAPAWYPGCGAATRWQLDHELFAKLATSIDELLELQARFVGAPLEIELMTSLLRSILLRVAVQIPDSVPGASGLPQPYVDFRERIEQRLYERPTVADLAHDLAYSTRTLDRACQRVANKTARQVLDDRIALEIRRLLTHTDRAVSRIGADFGFHDPSNFSKFVKRHLGDLPGNVREHPGPGPRD